MAKRLSPTKKPPSSSTREDRPAWVLWLEERTGTSVTAWSSPAEPRRADWNLGKFSRVCATTAASDNGIPPGPLAVWDVSVFFRGQELLRVMGASGKLWNGRTISRLHAMAMLLEVDGFKEEVWGCPK